MKPKSDLLGPDLATAQQWAEWQSPFDDALQALDDAFNALREALRERESGKSEDA